MKTILLGLIALSLFTAGCKDQKASDAAGSLTEPTKKFTKAEIDKAFADYATPGDMHKWMATMNGIWNADMTMWIYPDSPAVHTKGVAVYTMSNNGLHQQSVHTSDIGGMKFEGRSVMGYDNVKKMFVSTWYDNMGSGIMNMEGTYDAETKTYSARGKGVDPIQGKEVEMREVVKFTDDNTMQMEMYCTKDGKETKTMELTARRRQK